MTQTLTSTAPSIFSAALSLMQAAGAAQNPVINVVPFVPLAYRPGQYVTIEEIANYDMQWRTVDGTTFQEEYDLVGHVTSYQGDPASDPKQVLAIMSSVYSVAQTCVISPLMSNRNPPILGVTPSVSLMKPLYFRYSAGPALVDDEPSGWAAVIEWAFHFEAFISPS